jgi:hypothetical protein
LGARVLPLAVVLGLSLSAVLAIRTYSAGATNSERDGA